MRATTAVSSFGGYLRYLNKHQQPSFLCHQYRFQALFALYKNNFVLPHQWQSLHSIYHQNGNRAVNMCAFVRFFDLQWGHGFNSFGIVVTPFHSLKTRFPHLVYVMLNQRYQHSYSKVIQPSFCFCVCMFRKVNGRIRFRPYNLSSTLTHHFFYKVVDSLF